MKHSNEKTVNQSSNIVIHINESLDRENREVLTGKMCRFEGVVSADVKEKCPHLMIVGYDPEETKPIDVIMSVRDTGVHAQLIAWL